jgi:NADPH2:quinone reductase
MAVGRGMVVERFGGPEVLREREIHVGPPPPGHARVRVLAIGVGHTDLRARSGEYLPQRKRPFVPGYELAGEVVDHAGHAPAWLRPGLRVAVCLPSMGAYADYITLPVTSLVPIPHGLDPVSAATIPLDFLTAVSMLETHARVGPGDAVLIQGASGGVGQALSRLGKRMGLRMYGTASSPGPLAPHGVEFIDYRTQDFEAVLRAREPDGVRAVFDHLGGTALRKGYRVLGRGGVLVSYAFSGRPGRTVGDTLRGAALVSLMNLRPGRHTALCRLPREIRVDPDWYRRTLTRLLALARDGEISARPGPVHPLARAAEVHAMLERREITGKVVLTTT